MPGVGIYGFGPMPAESVTAAALRQERSARWQLPSGKQGVALHEGAALLFGLDGTLVDSVYEHVLAWREALEEAGIDSSPGLRVSADQGFRRTRHMSC